MANTNNKKGFWLFYDWIDDLEYLDGADAWKIIKAICEYYRDGVNPIDNVDERLKVIASIIFRQIKRGEGISEQRSKAGKSITNDSFVEQALNKTQKSTTNDSFVEQVLNKKQKNIANDSFAKVCLNKNQKITEKELLSKQNAVTNYLLHDTNYNNSFSLSNTESRQLKLVRGTLGKGKLFLSDDQLNDLCSKLSLDELEHYANAIIRSEEKGHYFGKTHYEAILEMANQDRWVKENAEK